MKPRPPRLPPLNTLLQKNKWHVLDSGALPGEANMELDRSNLEKLQSDSNPEPVLRFFEWTAPTVSYGYLLSPEKVLDWAKEFGTFIPVKRPTGGGVVLHQPSDLSVSVLWARGQGIFPENPRDCYEAIHQILLKAFPSPLVGEGRERGLPLYLQPSCQNTPHPNPLPMGEGERKKLSICYLEPVCNDVMVDGKKIIGGALRVTRKAILYQGNIQMGTTIDKNSLKAGLLSGFGEIFSF